MSGAGRKVFEPGAVLTASQVQNYLQDQAVQVYAGTAARGSAIGTATTEGMMSYLSDTNTVQMATGTATWVNVDSLPIVSGTAARAALYPSPVQGNTVYRSDVKYMETYHDAAGTAAAGWYSGQNGGLVPVIPNSIAVASGSASVSGNGLITITSASTLSLNGVFTSAFRDYKVMYNILGASSIIMSSRLRASGTDASTASTYGAGRLYGVDSGSGSQNNGYNDAFGLVPNSGAKNIGEITYLRPYLSVNTNIYQWGAVWTGETSVTSMAQQFGFCVHSPTNSYDGFTLFNTSSANMTGTVQVFGIRN